MFPVKIKLLRKSVRDKYGRAKIRGETRGKEGLLSLSKLENFTEKNSHIRTPDFRQQAEMVLL